MNDLWCGLQLDTYNGSDRNGCTKDVWITNAELTTEKKEKLYNVNVL